jgi:hypothetical protein
MYKSGPALKFDNQFNYCTYSKKKLDTMAVRQMGEPPKRQNNDKTKPNTVFLGSP